MALASRLSGLSMLIVSAIVAATAPATASDKTRRRRAPATAPAAQQAMLRKYVARCALRPDQTLAAVAGSAAGRRRFPGAIGLAPEWRDGTCTEACQEKVSACLAALTNPTGLHVPVSLMSAAPSMSGDLAPGENDLGYPHQEGAFFGNVFSGQVYVCRGRDADKSVQVKRFCAVAPALCSGIASFVDAGPCAQSCEMSCTELSDGSTRCAAVRCRDPEGRVWAHPITSYLRDGAAPETPTRSAAPAQRARATRSITAIRATRAARSS